MSDDKAVRWLAQKLREDAAALIAPRGQATGAFRKGPRAYELCPLCTTMRGRPTGVAKQAVRQHAAAHEDGLIVMPS